MKTFKDNSGRNWTVRIDVAAIKRVRGLLDVDLLDAVEGTLLERLVADPVLLCDVIYALCKPEADEAGIRTRTSGGRWREMQSNTRRRALLEELADFFPPARRGLLKKALAKMKALEAKAIEVAEARLESGEIEAEMEKALSGTGASSTNSPASSE